MNNDKTLLELFYSPHSGKVLKCLHFLHIYDSYFYPIKNEKLNILEIGIFHGGLNQLFKEYFPNSNLIGLDIDENCKKFADERVKVYIGDQTSTDLLQSIVEENGKLDIVIDDGGHTYFQQINTFKYLFNNLNNGGLYFIEDVCTSYWDSYKGNNNIANNNNYDSITTVQYFKEMIDKLNCNYTNRKDFDEFDKGIFSINFFDNLILINKILRDEENKFGQELFV